MTIYMLDTNTVSYLLKQHQTVMQRIQQVPISALCISAITEGELCFGLAKRPNNKSLHLAVEEMLKRFDVLPWSSSTAQIYGRLRQILETNGKPLASLDMLIAAHAMEVGAILVTSDKAFLQIKGIKIEDWTID